MPACHHPGTPGASWPKGTARPIHLPGGGRGGSLSARGGGEPSISSAAGGGPQACPEGGSWTRQASQQRRANRRRPLFGHRLSHWEVCRCAQGPARQSPGNCHGARDQLAREVSLLSASAPKWSHNGCLLCKPLVRVEEMRRCSARRDGCGVATVSLWAGGLAADCPDVRLALRQSHEGSLGGLQGHLPTQH